MPKDRIWGKYTIDPHLASEAFIRLHQDKLDEVNDRIFFYLNQSNLARVVSSSNLDLAGGTGVIWIESQSDDVPLYFRSCPAVATYIEYSTDDVISTCWYQTKLSGRQIINTFPDYRGSRYSDFNEGADANELHVVIYGQIKYNERSFYIYAVLESDPDYPLFERESDYQQIILYRDRVRPGEAEGRGIATDLLPSIKDLNRLVMYHRQSMSFKANPPLFVDSTSYFNPYSVRQWAGSIIMANMKNGEPVKAMQFPDHPEVIEHIRDLRNDIKSAFQVDPLGEIQSPVKSATEVSIRENRAQRTSATDISRLINELPRQIYEVSAKILSKRKLISHDRETKIIDFPDTRLRFDFQSPLFDIQNREDLSRFTTMAQLLQQFYGEGAVIAASNLPEIRAFLTEKLNLPAKLWKNEEQLKQELINMGQVQQNMQNAQLPRPATSAIQHQGLPRQDVLV